MLNTKDYYAAFDDDMPEFDPDDAFLDAFFLLNPLPPLPLALSDNFSHMRAHLGSTFYVDYT